MPLTRTMKAVGLLAATAMVLGAIAILIAHHEHTRAIGDEETAVAGARTVLGLLLDRASSDAARLEQPENAVPPAGAADSTWTPRDHELLARCRDLYQDAEEAHAVYDFFGHEAWPDGSVYVSLGEAIGRLQQAPAQCFSPAAGLHVDGAPAARAAIDAIGRARTAAGIAVAKGAD